MHNNVLFWEKKIFILFHVLSIFLCYICMHVPDFLETTTNALCVWAHLANKAHSILIQIAKQNNTERLWTFK